MAWLQQFPAADRTAFNLMKRMARALSESEEAYARDHGVYYRLDVIPAGPAVDRSGTDLSAGDEKTYRLFDGQSKTVTFNRSGTIKIFGFSGTQLLAVIDSGGEHQAGTMDGYRQSVVGPGSYTFSVRSVGGDIAVKLV